MARRRELERAKRKILAESATPDWVASIGIGRIDRKLGLIISVMEGKKRAANQSLKKLELKVPVLVRSVAEIKAGTPKETVEDTEDEIKKRDKLRALAEDRLNSQR